MQIRFTGDYCTILMDSPEAWRQVDAHVFVSLFETAVFANKVQIIATDDDGSLHFHFANNSGQDSATDRAHSSEWTLLVDIVA